MSRQLRSETVAQSDSLQNRGLLLILCSLAALASDHAYAQYNCVFSEPQYGHLSVNGVEARIAPNQDFLLPYYGTFAYEVPAGSGVYPLYSANMIVGGLIGDELRIITGEIPTETWPGPLDEDGVPPSACTDFNRTFKVSVADVLEYEATGVPNEALLSWPWQFGAPVVDADGIEDNYHLAAGDRPRIEGHEMLWWVMNDLGGNANLNDRKPIGLEIQVSAFAATSNDPAIEYATFYRYHMTHRGEGPLTDAFFGMYLDPDVGNGSDDLAGSDTTLGLAFAYNGDNFEDDPGRFSNGYEDRPAALGTAIVEGILVDDDGVDNDEDGVIDESDERLPMTKVVQWDGSGTTVGYPQSPVDYYAYLRGLWRDGSPVTFGGSGRGFSETPVDFMYPGEPPAFWSEEDIDGNGSGNQPADRNFLWSTGPFSLDVGESRDIVVAVIWARGEDRYDSIRRLKEAVSGVRDAWANGFEIPLPPPPSTVPDLYSPGYFATQQPTNVRLVWSNLPDGQRYEVQVAIDPQFSSLVDSAVTAEAGLELDLHQRATYYWRVRGVNISGKGPWSETRPFMTGETSLVEPGPLDIDGNQSWAFIQVQGASENDACGLGSGSTFGCSQVGGNWVYGSFNGTGEWIMYHEGQGPEGSIGRFSPRDFELRFNESGSYGLHAFGSGRTLRVPFEAWDVGPVGPFGINDPSDDERLLPGIFSDNGGECDFGFGEIEEDPFGLGWPVTDRIYAFYPSEGFSYDDWHAAVEPLVDADPSGCPASPETDHLFDLVDTDRRPLQRLTFMMDPTSPNYRPEGIPVGNVIRFLTAKPTPPILSSPVDGEVLGTFSTIDVPLWWHLPPEIDSSRVQVDTSIAFNSVIIDTLVAGPSVTLDDVHVGLYYWRVGYSIDTEFWSEPWAFHVSSLLATEDVAEFPTELSIRQPYPNPTADIAHFEIGLPETGRVMLTAYDLLGRRVANIADDPMAAGWRTVDWNTEVVSNGVYMVRLQAGGAAVSAKVVVVK